mmetsp:Transcript_87630/g.152995  ORF Transcript_87630/g.152995 Transcript_87630/m.152995 type:complete len:136 (-) Transcript_87630:12-419(-)
MLAVLCHLLIGGCAIRSFGVSARGVLTDRQLDKERHEKSCDSVMQQDVWNSCLSEAMSHPDKFSGFGDQDECRKHMNGDFFAGSAHCINLSEHVDSLIWNGMSVEANKLYRCLCQHVLTQFSTQPKPMTMTSHNV